MSAKAANGLEKRFQYGFPITNTSSPENRQYFCVLGILCTKEEFASFRPGGRSWADFQARFGRKDAVPNLIHLLIQCFDRKETIDLSGIDTFFIRDDNVGHVILICIRTMDIFNTWSTDLYEYMRDIQKSSNKSAGSKNTPRAVGDITDFQLPNSIIHTINGAIHPAIATTCALKTHTLYTFGSIVDCFDRINTYIRDTQPPDAAAFRYMDEPMLTSEHITRETLCNPFIALNVHRIFRIAQLIPINQNLDYLCTDAAGSIFAENGRIDFSNLPNHVTAYQVSFFQLSAAWFFPDVLPSMATMRDIIIEIQPSLAPIIATLDDPTLEHAILHETLLPGADDFLKNPLSSGRMFVEEIPSTAYDMPYLKEFQKMMKNARSKKLPMAQMRTELARIIVQCINTMASDTDSTPDGMHSASNMVKEGLAKVGLHFVKPKDRPSYTSAYIAWIIQQLERLGTSVHHTSMGLTNLMAVLTSFSSDNGGVHIHHAGNNLSLSLSLFSHSQAFRETAKPTLTTPSCASSSRPSTA